MNRIEFLLARIAEDKRMAEGWRGENAAVEFHEHGDVYVMDTQPWVRVLAECEAKRRIVELRESAQYQVAKAGDDPTDAFALTWRSQVIAFDAALSTLADAYSDHPDYANVST